MPRNTLIVELKGISTADEQAEFDAVGNEWELVTIRESPSSRRAYFKRVRQPQNDDETPQLGEILLAETAPEIQKAVEEISAEINQQAEAQQTGPTIKAEHDPAMDVVLDKPANDFWSECHCPCHSNHNVRHCAPCCEHCSLCGMNIVFGGIEVHKRQFHRLIDPLDQAAAGIASLPPDDSEHPDDYGGFD